MKRVALLMMVGALVLGLAAPAGAQDYPAAHDNAVELGNCVERRIERCNIANGPQYVRINDGAPWLAMQVWRVDEQLWLIARNPTGQIRAIRDEFPDDDVHQASAAVAIETTTGELFYASWFSESNGTLTRGQLRRMS